MGMARGCETGRGVDGGLVIQILEFLEFLEIAAFWRVASLERLEILEWRVGARGWGRVGAWTVDGSSNLGILGILGNSSVLWPGPLGMLGNLGMEGVCVWGDREVFSTEPAIGALALEVWS